MACASRPAVPPSPRRGSPGRRCSRSISSPTMRWRWRRRRTASTRRRTSSTPCRPARPGRTRCSTGTAWREGTTMRRFAERQPGPRINRSELVMVAVIGQASSQLAAANPYRIGQDGRPRVLPGPGGIVLSHRVGDACVGLAADHVEPGVSIRNEQTSIKGERGGANLALQTLACIGNQARVVTGRAAGAIGTVTGKHGGIDTVLIDFPLFDRATVRRYRLGSLRFGDLVAIVDADHRFGRSWRRGHVAIGCVVHSESSVAGHGPGVTTLLTGAANRFVLRHDANANVAAILGLRRPVTPRNVLPLAVREAAWRGTLARSSPAASPPVASAAIDRRLLHVRL